MTGLILEPELDRHQLPGDVAVWIFIFAELTVFGIMLIGFAVARSLDPATFHAGRDLLHTWIGLLNTAALITSSYLVATAVHQSRDKLSGAQWRLWLAVAVSCIYTVGKLYEYVNLYSQGYNLGTDTFFMFYFFLTFFHLMHVTLGQIVLMVLAVRIGNRDCGGSDMNSMESGASYWHMVDLVWLALFPVLYVLA
ncbi:cytochrome oxidase subunit III [Marinobacter psychrophilus]|jgi:nitric oxide reductase NorE protein|uniref:Cytochrome oxidase subunit III n=1 Tax=Marinobacter psychrophilus TaxID=330734 RepID=A0A0H4I3I1_9GAMM|nr:cytochrome c oxidase subunit 3 [Marinobacter psychrophilus]AKO53554.1 cytochrome oxidase subunit III [Marinobacter psychrophilus]